MNPPFNILVIDDEPVVRDSCFQILSRKGCEISLSENGRKGLKCLSDQQFDVIILDLKIPDINGFEILKKIHLKTPETIVIIITGYPTVQSAVEAMKMGAYDFIPKPFTPSMLRTVVARALEKRRLYTDTLSVNKELDTLDGNNAIVGRSLVISELKRFIKRAGISDCSVLITGETGTGKELVARSLHYYSRRRNNNFIIVDSGGLVDSLIESELFGHEKGSFTGAISDRIGRFELADDGTLFFDEISNMSFRIQGKLLRVLQEYEINRIGNSRFIPVDVRIIAATNCDITNEIKKGNFREDLYYRLNVIPIHLPSLRERREDIPVLANYFLKRFREEKSTAIPERITDRAMKDMMQYEWPGNVRELEHLIKRTVALSDDREVNPFEIASEISITGTDSFIEKKSSQQLNAIEKVHIEKMLKIFHYNKSQTSKALGIDRKTLRSKIRKHGICGSEIHQV